MQELLLLNVIKTFQEKCMQVSMIDMNEPMILH